MPLGGTSYGRHAAGATARRVFDSGVDADSRDRPRRSALGGGANPLGRKTSGITGSSDLKRPKQHAGKRGLVPSRWTSHGASPFAPAAAGDAAITADYVGNSRLDADVFDRGFADARRDGINRERRESGGFAHLSSNGRIWNCTAALPNPGESAIITGCDRSFATTG